MNAYSELNGAGALLDQYDRPRNADAKGWMIDYDVALKRTFEPRKHELSGELRFNRAHDQDFTALWRQPSRRRPSALRTGERATTTTTRSRSSSPRSSTT